MPVLNYFRLFIILNKRHINVRRKPQPRCQPGDSGSAPTSDDGCKQQQSGSDDSESGVGYAQRLIFYRKMFIGGISTVTTESRGFNINSTNLDSLRQYFVNFGEVQDPVIMRDKETSKMLLHYLLMK